MKKLLTLIYLLLPSCLINAQNVGVGTTAPQQKLHVAGNVRVDALAGTQGVIKYNTNGDLIALPNSSNPKHVLLGDGTWGSGTVPAGAMIATVNYNDPELINNGYTLSGYLPDFVRYDNFTGPVAANTWLVTYLEGDVTKYTPPGFNSNDIFFWYNGELFTFANNKFHAYNPLTDTWRFVMDNPSSYGAATGAKSVWTGTELIVWGGSYTGASNNGFRYNPATNIFTAIPLSGQPTARSSFAMHFISNRLVIWGGLSGGVEQGNGAVLNLATNTWSATSSTGAPSARYGFTSVVNTTQNIMMIWGGALILSGIYYNDGAMYNPVTNTWSAITTTGAPASRLFHVAIWSGSEMIVQGGSDAVNFLNTGGRYNPVTNNWVATAISLSPVRRNHAAIWTGSKLLLHGGYSSATAESGGSSEATSYLYNPTTNIWENAGPAGIKKAAHKLIMADNIILAFGGLTVDPLGVEVFGYPVGSRYFLTPQPSVTSTSLYRFNKLYLYRKL